MMPPSIALNDGRGATKRIVAIGGGGFLMEDGRSPIDDYILALAAKPCPRICFIPTPSGDSEEHLDKFYAAFSPRDCRPSHLAFFRKQRPNALPLSDFPEHLLAQDAIFVGGGNTKSALAVWREWKLDAVLKQAWSTGVLLSGMSAGAMCWFQQGLTDSFWGPECRPLACLGFLAGGCAVHYGSDAKRRTTLHAAIEAGAIAPSLAIDDYAAAVYSDGELSRVVSWSDNATAYHVSLEDGLAKEQRYKSERLTRDKTKF